MRQTAPRRRIDWLYWLCVALFVATLLLVMTYGATHAHGGQLSDSSRQPIRQHRLTLRTVRAQGRAQAGYPLRQAIKYTAKTAANVSAPLGWLSPGGFIRGLVFRGRQ